MEFRKPLVLSFSLLAFATASAHAQQAGKEPGASEAQPSMSQGSSEGSAAAGASGQHSTIDPSNAQTSELIGTKVTDKQGKEIGEIDEVVIDLQNGKLYAAVLSFGGFMGIGEKQFAFPAGELEPGQQGQLTMDIDKQKLESREGFAKGQWPAMDDEYWGRVGGQAAAGSGQAKQAQKMTLVRASELKGKSVSDNAGKDVGEIEDVYVDLNSGEVKNIAINVQDGGGRAMVKPDALAKGTGDKLLISMSAEQLKSQAKQSGSGSSGGGSAGPSK